MRLSRWRWQSCTRASARVFPDHFGARTPEEEKNGSRRTRYHKHNQPTTYTSTATIDVNIAIFSVLYTAGVWAVATPVLPYLRAMHIAQIKGHL